MRMMFVSVLAVLFVTASGNDCTDGMTRCLQTFVYKVSIDFYRLDLMCRDLENYIRCVFTQNCLLTPEIEQTLYDIVKTQLEKFGVTCPFSVHDVIKEYKNNASTLSGTMFASLGLVLLALWKLIV